MNYSFISSLFNIILLTSIVLFSSDDAIAQSISSKAPCSTPPAPTAVTTTSSTNSVTFNVTNAVAGNSTHILIQVCNYNYGGCTNAFFTNTGGVYTITGLECNTTFYYRIRNFENAGSGCYSSDLTGYVSTGPCATTPSNDNCTNATLLTIGGGQNCFSTAYTNYEQTEGICSTSTSTICHWETQWYIFQANSTSSTILLNETQQSTYKTDVVAFGPYDSQAAASADCNPSSSNIVSNGGSCITNFDNYDPLFSFDFPTDSSKFYLVQILNEDCNAGTEDYTGCISVYSTPQNNEVGGSSGIDECGLVYNGTNIGYSPSNGLPGMENLDNNTGTTCSGCTSGDEVPYVINNDSWFFFCTTSAGDWSIDFNGISNCINGDGLQMTIFTGTPSALTAVWNASSPSAPGSSQTSPTMSLSSGECVYMVVDGFAGDQCDYSYTLNNLTTTCDLVALSADLSMFHGFNLDGVNHLIWTTESEKNTDKFIVEISQDGENWTELTTVKAAGDSESKLTYTVYDDRFTQTLNYYRLLQYDLNGELNWIESVAIDNTLYEEQIIRTYNLLGQEVDSLYKGMVIHLLSNGKTIKTVQ